MDWRHSVLAQFRLLKLTLGVKLDDFLNEVHVLSSHFLSVPDCHKLLFLGHDFLLHLFQGLVVLIGLSCNVHVFVSYLVKIQASFG